MQIVYNDFDSILMFINDDWTEEIRMFKYKTEKVDRLRNESVLDVFPELAGMI